MTMNRPAKDGGTHKWEFKARFRRHAFGWKSQPAITRIKQAVAEIKKVAQKDAMPAAEGAVTFLERVSPAIEQVDSSSGSIGTAVNNAIAELVPIIASAPSDTKTRDAWLERLFEAFQIDAIPFIEALGDHWGTLCASKEVASKWADRLVEGVENVWRPDTKSSFFKGTTCCLSALVAAERFDDVLALLERAPFKMWLYRQYGVTALAAKGEVDEAIRYAEKSRGLNDSRLGIARACEAVLLAAGRAEEAYQSYGLLANAGGTYLATFRAVAKKYPHKPKGEILADLVESTPGDEGKWFATAKSLGLYDEALALAGRSPCDPKTLTRAAREHAEERPEFAVGAGLLALHWLVQGHGYEITGADVFAARSATMAAAEQLGRGAEVNARIRALVAAERPGGFVSGVLGRGLDP
jgi:tetratricopeptide (TPR) repeat protein